jgi:hypothetical protein
MDFSRNFNLSTRHPDHFPAALSYLQRGWSVIPVFGEQQPERQKAAAVSWKTFQHKHASTEMLAFWFRQQGYQLAIITGQISRLAVLDLDSPQQFANFQEQHPDLTITYSVATKRGFHLYFHVPAHLNTRSLRGEGLDWQWEGRYVVAPPSQVAGHRYSVSSQRQIRTVTQADLERIEQFVGIPVSHQPGSLGDPEMSELELVNLYRKHAQPGNRNNALFQAALRARDRGFSANAVSGILLPEYTNGGVDTLSTYVNMADAPIARAREAHATIRSAFSRPPRPVVATSTTLPTVLMEALFQSGQAATVRLLNALYQLGYRAGMYISREEALAALSGTVGSHSIRKALASGLFSFTEQRENPSPAPPTHKKHAAIHSSQRPISKCFEIKHSKPSENLSRGRFTRFYRIPSTRELANKLGVGLRLVQDQLPADALKSAKETRKAVHRAYLERRPGKYPSKWLAKRLGVSVITKNRYDREIPDLHKHETHSSKRIGWHNLDELSTDLAEIGGVYLMDEQGKKYPLSKGLAAALLKQGRALTLMRRSVNSYWIGSKWDGNPDEWLTHIQTRKHKLPAADFRSYWQDLENSPAARMPRNRVKTAQIPLDTAPMADSTDRYVKAPKNASSGIVDSSYELKALHDLHERINALCSPDQHISLRTLHGLLRDHSSATIRKAVGRIAERSNVSNPVGLLITLLKSQKTVTHLTELHKTP